MRLFAMTCALAVLGAGSAPAQDADRGRALAERWCVSCHVVGPDAGGADAGPAFSALSVIPDRSDGELRAWIMAPHASMLRLDLTDDDIADLIAHIRSLSQ